MTATALNALASAGGLTPNSWYVAAGSGVRYWASDAFTLEPDSADARSEIVAGTRGTRIMSWAGSGTSSDAARAIKASYNRTTFTDVLSTSPDRDAPTVIRISGSSAGTQIYYQETLTSSFVDTAARNIGVWVRALPRSDGESYANVLVWLTADSGGSMDFGGQYASYKFPVRTDGAWRLYVLPVVSNGGYGSNSTFIPGTGRTIAWARVGIPNTGAAGEFPVLPDGDFVEFGPLYLNPRGGTAAAIVRFDDGKASVHDAMGAAWSTPFSGGFTGRSGVVISSSDGALMSMVDLVEEFGFRSSHFILCRMVGATVGYASLAQLQSLQARGHFVGFQSYYNPLGSTTLGARMLGPYGYNSAGAAGSITSVAGTVATQAGHLVDTFTTATAEAGPQGFPVVFDATGLPVTITAGVTYWLRRQSSTTWSAHPTEQDSWDNANAIDLTGATATSMVYRYFGSTNDYTGILADYTAGKAWFLANGFGYNYRVYALNQSSYDRYVRQAIEEFGEFRPAFGGNVPENLYSLTLENASYVNPNTALDARAHSDWLICESNVGVDTLTTEAAVREYVRGMVQEGALFQNIGHACNVQMLTWYLDELKFWSDAGMCYVDTADRVLDAVRS